MLDLKFEQILSDRFKAQQRYLYERDLDLMRKTRAEWDKVLLSKPKAGENFVPPQIKKLPPVDMQIDTNFDIYIPASFTELIKKAYINESNKRVESAGLVIEPTEPETNKVIHGLLSQAEVPSNQQ